MGKLALFDASLAWDVSVASYANKSFDVSNEGGNDNEGVFIGNSGTKLYISSTLNTAVYQYTLSTPWDISTASYDSVSYDATGLGAIITDITFSSSGTKLFILGILPGKVFQHTLSTAWDLSSISYDSVEFSVNSESTTPLGLFFRDDGKRFYTINAVNDRVFQYSLSAAFNLTTASYDSVSFLVSGQEGTPESIFFRPNGKRMFVIGVNNDSVYQYDLSTPWDVSTAVYNSVSFSVAGQETGPNKVFIRDNGLNMYILGTTTGEAVYQYSLVG